VQVAVQPTAALALGFNDDADVRLLRLPHLRPPRLLLPYTTLHRKLARYQQSETFFVRAIPWPEQRGVERWQGEPPYQPSKG
jgi:hypothetical protein